MKIDIKNCKKIVKEYVSKYNLDDPKIKLKMVHIEKVSFIAGRIATKENLNKEDIELAKLIGLLHDIGRFEQIKRYNTFNDNKSVDHAKLGVKILFEEGLIRKFISTNEFDEIIKKSILNHNKKNIEDNLSKRELLHANIIRDADKTDIYRILTTDDKMTIYGKDSLEDEKITKEVYDEYLYQKNIDYINVKTPIDLLLCHFKYICDLNFKESKNIIKENRYLEKLYARFRFNDSKIQEMFDNVFRLAIKNLNC